MSIFRIVIHDEGHWDIEKFFSAPEFTGWAVIVCHDEDTNKECNMNEKHFHGTRHFKGGIDMPCKKTKLLNPCACGMFEKQEGMDICAVCEVTQKAQADIARWRNQQAAEAELEEDGELLDRLTTETNLPAYYPLGVYHFCFLCGEKMDHGGTCERCKVKIRNSNVKLQPYKTGNKTYSTEPSWDAFEEDTQIW